MRDMQVRLEQMNDHMMKVHLPGIGVAHYFTDCDGPESEPHDHPWPFESTVHIGGYIEEVFDPENPDAPPQVFERRPGETFVNKAGTVHRIVRLIDGYTLTTIKPGEWERKTGFYQFRDGQVFHRYHDEKEWHQWPRS